MNVLLFSTTEDVHILLFVTTYGGADIRINCKGPLKAHEELSLLAFQGGSSKFKSKKLVKKLGVHITVFNLILW